MKICLAICMMVAASITWAAEESPTHGGAVEGQVLEVKNVPQFTYLRLKTQAGESWAAVVTADVKKGDTVTIENAMVMGNFQSKSLKRTFKKILFGNLRGANVAATPSGTSALGKSFAISPGMKPQPMMAGPNKQPTAEPVVEPIAKASGANAITVAEIVTQSAALKGKPVLVRGKVVKYNPEIMGKNWIHLQDGSGSAASGTDDILVTTTSKAGVGDVVTVKGTVNVDQDFGAGYAYKVLIEEATLQK